jgi:hypothetical protein
MMDYWGKVRRITKASRNVMEHYAKANNFNKDLGGLCFDASAYLAKRLRRNGIRSKVVASNYHCFLKLKGKIIDITASQFGGPAILIVDQDKADKVLTRSYKNTYKAGSRNEYCPREAKDIENFWRSFLANRRKGNGKSSRS